MGEKGVEVGEGGEKSERAAFEGQTTQNLELFNEMIMHCL